MAPRVPVWQLEFPFAIPQPLALVALGRGASPGVAKLLRKQAELLTKIKSEQALLRREAALARETARQVQLRIEPLYERFQTLLAEIRATFELVLETRRLSARNRAAVHWLYSSLFGEELGQEASASDAGGLPGTDDGADSEKLADPFGDEADDDPFGDDPEGDFSDLDDEDPDETPLDDELERLLQAAEAEDALDGDLASVAAEHDDAREAVNGAGEGPKSSRAERIPEAESDDAGASAAASSVQSDRARLRALFRRLAAEYHPDHARDPADRKRRTETMKRLTLAYQSGDLADLLSLSHSRQGPSSGPDPAGRERELQSENRRLQRQLSAIRKELAELRAEHPSLECVERTGDGRVEIRDPVELELQQEVNRLVRLRDFVQAFAERKLTIKQFLAGPSRSEPPASVPRISDVASEELQSHPL